MTGVFDLSPSILRLVRRLPDALLHDVASLIATGSAGNWTGIRIQLHYALPQPDLRAEIDELLTVWQTQCPQLSPEAVALALLTAAQIEAYHRSAQTVELVWTGPRNLGTPARRIDQVLLQMIDEAQSHLQIVSFAVYKAQGIVQALNRAVERGIEITLYLEFDEASDGKIRGEPLRALGNYLLEHAEIYIWPLDQRERSSDDRYGSLHAKIAIADGQAMLISSANLTDYAMTLNIEAGILVHGGALPAQTESYLQQLVERSIFQRFTP